MPIRRLLGRWCSQLHKSKRIVQSPLLNDLAVLKAIHIHTGDFDLSLREDEGIHDHRQVTGCEVFHVRSMMIRPGTLNAEHHFFGFFAGQVTVLIMNHTIVGEMREVRIHIVIRHILDHRDQQHFAFIRSQRFRRSTHTARR